MPRNPAPAVHPRDPVLGPLKGFFDWVHRRLDAEIPPMVTAAAYWDPPNIATSPGFASTTVEVPGAQLISDGSPRSHIVTVGFSNTLPAGAFVVASLPPRANIVTVTLVNLTGGALNASSGSVRVHVWREL